MLLKSSSLLQILLLLALVVSLTASPMEESDDDKGKQKEDQSFPNPEILQLLEHTNTAVEDTMITRKITVLGGIKCDSNTLGLTACFAEKRYRGDVLSESIFRKDFPEISSLRNIYQCIMSEYVSDTSNSLTTKRYQWSEMRCLGNMSFCSIQQISTLNSHVRVLCMGETSAGKGNNHWYDASQVGDEGEFNSRLQKLNKNKKEKENPALFMNRLVVTDARMIFKEYPKKLGHIIDDAKYEDMLITITQKIEKPPSKLSVAAQVVGGFGTKLGESVSKKSKAKQ